MKSKISKTSEGFTLLEVITAIFIISIGIAAVYRVMPALISGSSINSSRVAAAYLAQEGIEIVRNVKDGNWLEAAKRGDGTAWNEGFFSPVDCSNDCEIDYRALGVDDPVFSSYAARKIKISSADFYNYTFGTETKFRRKITIQSGGSDKVTVSSEVSWQDRNKDYKFTVKEELYKADY